MTNYSPEEKQRNTLRLKALGHQGQPLLVRRWAVMAPNTF